MRILAIDTALDLCSVAFVTAAGRGPALSEPLARGHAERLFAMVEAVLAEDGATLEDADRIAVTIGPGSFTGIRIGLAAARGFALALGRPVIGVDTLEALAASAAERPSGPVFAAIDARKGEVYAAVHHRGTEVVAPFAADVAAALDRVPHDCGLVIGSGAPLLAHAATVAGRRLPPLEPLAGPDIRKVAAIAAARAPAARPPAPLYLRAPDAKPQAGRMAHLFAVEAAS